jgi:hypothetical protein
LEWLVKMPKMNVNLPNLIFVDDYHEFSYYTDNFSDIIPNLKIKELGKELGVDEGRYVGLRYVGLIYVGKLPKQKVIDVLCDKYGIVF